MIDEQETHSPEAIAFDSPLYVKRKGMKVGLVHQLTGESALIECSNVPEAKKVFETAEKMIACGADDLAQLARDLMTWHGEGKRKELRDRRPGRCPHCDSHVETPAGADVVCHECGSSFSVGIDGSKNVVDG